MDFLKCDPSVFVIGEEYEILVIAKENGIISIEVDGEQYYEDNSGVLASEKNYVKIRVPSERLNCAKEYSVLYRKTIDRKAYFSEIGDTVLRKYSFKPLEKDEDIRIYFLSDVHYKFEKAIAAASYYGKDTDLFVIGGDIGEVETVTNYEEVAAFCAALSGGEIPILFVRGNHDTRGHLAELYCNYFPSNGKQTYYTATVGPLWILALDCGEDKPDSCPEYTYPKPDVYGGVNIFSAYRKAEGEYLKRLPEPPKDKLPFAVSHIPPAMSTLRDPDSVFYIEQDRYAEWNKELLRLGIKFMLSGHYHKAFTVDADDKRRLIAGDYPLIIGAELTEDNYVGSAILLGKHGISVRFTDKNRNTVGTYEAKF